MKTYLRRSALYIPGDSEKMMQRGARASGICSS